MRWLARQLTRPGPLLATGLAISAAAGSLFLATVNHTVSTADVAALTGLYFLLAIVGTGLLAGLEQEMTRTVSRSLALGTSPAASFRQQLRQAAALAIGTVLLMAAGAQFIVEHWLAGRWYLLGELLLGLLGTWAAYLVRGLLSGYQDFRLYAVTLVVEGLSRLAPSLLLAFTHSGSAWAYGLCYALGPGVSAAVGVIGHRSKRGARPSAAGTPSEADHQKVGAGRAASNLALLTLATLASQVVMNAVPLAVVPRLASNTALGAAIGSAIGVTRLALLALFPLQAPLLPKLAAAAAQARFDEVRRRTAFLVGAVVVVGLLGVAGSAVFGPWVLESLMGTKAHLSGGFLAALALGTMFLMIAFVLQSTLIAVSKHAVTFTAWGVGVAAMFVIFALPISAPATATAASIAGPLAVTFVELLGVRIATRHRAAATRADAVADPLESMVGP